MSQLVNTRYAKDLRRGRYKPVYIAVFDGIPTRFSTGPVTSQQGPTLPYITGLAGGAAQVTVDMGRSSLANTSLQILDAKSFVTKTAFEYQLGNRKVTIKAGFQGLPEANYVNAFVGRVNNYTLQPDNGIWAFDLVSLMTDTFVNIFDNSAIEQGDITDTATVINVDSTVGWPNASNGQMYLLIGLEVIGYTAKTPTSFTGLLRGQLGTVAASHSDQDSIGNMCVLQDNPLNIALQILTSTGAGTNGPYDVLPANMGLAIDQSLVNVAQFEHMRDTWMPGVTFRFEEFASVQGKQFLEEQVYTFCNAYPVIDNNGLLSVNVYVPPLPNQINPEVNDKVLAQPPTFSGNVFSTFFYNEIDFSYDYNVLTDLNNSSPNSSTGPYDKRVFYEDPASQATFEQAATKVWQSRGVRSALMTNQRIGRIATRFLKRFSVPSPLIMAKVFYEARLLQQADIIPLTSAHIPNLDTGEMGVKSRLMEILGIAPDYLNGAQTLTLLDTGYSYQRKYGAISPSAKPPINFPNFPAASASQRNYAFISMKTGPSAGIMGDGSDGYYITP